MCPKTPRSCSACIHFCTNSSGAQERQGLHNTLQADTHRALSEPAHGSNSPVHCGSNAMEPLGVSIGPAYEHTSPAEPLESSDKLGTDKDEQLLHEAEYPSAAVAAQSGYGSFAPQIKACSGSPDIVPADLPQASPTEHADTATCRVVISAAAKGGPEQDSFQHQPAGRCQQGVRLKLCSPVY